MEWSEAIKEIEKMDERCSFCRYEYDCNRKVLGGPNGPIYPPCADLSMEDYFDIESYIVEREEELEAERIGNQAGSIGSTEDLSED